MSDNLGANPLNERPRSQCQMSTAVIGAAPPRELLCLASITSGQTACFAVRQCKPLLLRVQLRRAFVAFVKLPTKDDAAAASTTSNATTAPACSSEATQVLQLASLGEDYMLRTCRVPPPSLFLSQCASHGKHHQYACMLCLAVGRRGVKPHSVLAGHPVHRQVSCLCECALARLCNRRSRWHGWRRHCIRTPQTSSTHSSTRRH